MWIEYDHKLYNLDMIIKVSWDAEDKSVFLITEQRTVNLLFPDKIQTCLAFNMIHEMINPISITERLNILIPREEKNV